MRRPAWILLAIALLSAGCLGLGSDEKAAEPEPAEPASENSTDQTAAEASGEGESSEQAETSPPAPERSLDAPPNLVDGEWWTVEITSEFVGMQTEVTIVKAGGHGDKYMIGMPDAEFVDDAVLLHLPPQGSVESSTMGYPVHSSVFQPLAFPLEEGQTWETNWLDEPVEAEVVEAGDGQARVEMIGDNQLIEVHYVADLGMPKSIQIDGYGGYEVVDHGFGYEGDVHVPWKPEILFLNGRIAGAIDTQLSPAPPVEEIEVSGDHEEAVVALLLGNAFADEAPGYYEASAQAPNGDTHEASLVAGPTGESFALEAARVKEPTGTWRMEYVAGGVGIAAAEAIGYDAMHVVHEDGEFRMMDME